MHKLVGHLDRINTIAFSQDGQLIASASRDATVKLWNATTGTLERTFSEHLACINRAAFSPNSNLIVSASNDRIVGLWDMSCGGVHYKLHGHTGKVNTVIFSHVAARLRLVRCNILKHLRNRIFGTLAGRNDLRTILSKAQLATKAIRYTE